MKFTISKENLHGALSKVRAAIPSCSTLPILKHVAIKADQAGTCSFTTTDLNLTSIATVQATLVQEPGSLTVPFSIRVRIARLTYGAELSFEDAKSRLKILCGASAFSVLG